MMVMQMVELFEYAVTYHTENGDDEIILYAENIEKASESAKRFRQDDFSIERRGGQR